MAARALSQRSLNFLPTRMPAYETCRGLVFHCVPLASVKGDLFGLLYRLLPTVPGAMQELPAATATLVP